MKNHCELNDRECIQNKIAGLGEKSFRKSYYPELQKIERLKALLDQSNDAIFLLSIPEGRFVDVNHSVSEQLGHDCEDILKMSIYDIICDSAGTIKDIISGNVSSIVFTASICGPTGEKIPYEINARTANFGGKAYAILAARNIEKRLRIERALRESEEKFRVLAETSAAAIFVYQDEWNVSVNNAAVRMTGYSKDELLKMKLWKIIHPDYQEMVRERVLSRQRGESVPSRYEVKLLTKGGETRWAEIIAGRITYKGKPAGVATIIDITERKRAEEKLSYLASYPVLNPNPIIETDLKGAINYMNSAASGLFPNINAIGRRHPMLEGLEDIIYRLKNEGIPSFSREIKVDSSYYQETIIKLPEKDMIRIYTMDITERKRIEKKQQLTQFAVDNFTDSSIWISPDGSIIYVNKITCKNLGYTSDELLSMKIWDIDPDHYYERHLETWNKLKQKGTLNFESTHVRKDGSSYPVEVSIKYLEFEDKKYMVTFDRDITVRKWEEKELSDTKAQAEMYLDLMGHDINNVNQVALGYLELADDVIKSGGELGEDNRELIEKPIASLNNSSKLIKNVMKLRNIKNMELRLKRIDICDILAQLKNRYSNITGKSITINYIPFQECWVMGNELIDEIFINLIENSIKHSPPDRPLVIDIIQKKVCKDGKEYNWVSVEDNGLGISDEVKEKLFTRFSRGETKAKGKGLGLYLIKILVEDLHGKVWAEDRVKGDHTKGIRFVVMLQAVE